MERSKYSFMISSIGSARHALAVNPSFLTRPKSAHNPTVLDWGIRGSERVGLGGVEGRRGVENGRFMSV